LSSKSIHLYIYIINVFSSRIKHDKGRLYSAKANLDTIDNVVKNQLANVKITGIMQKSNEVARSMAQLMKVEQFQSVSAQFSKELIKVKYFY
jgi:division protein CdvB (Snf7/Vps24/ESCRT-III family)